MKRARLSLSPGLAVHTVIDRGPDEVWERLRDIGSHVDWMHDAVAIRFLSEQREGVGTRFECDTRVGPFALTDVMEIISWDVGRRMGVRHVGLVEGVGEFVLRSIEPGRTEFRWEEALRFPWYVGGPLAAIAARPFLRAVWKRNLARFRDSLA